MERNVTKSLAVFSSETEFDDLPDAVVHETKRIILDSLGCALGGPELEKGKIAVRLARYLGGRPESSILTAGDKVSSTNAAFANAELMHAMDFDPVLPPAHVSPFVIPAALALAECRKASGKNLITAVALGHEIASRIGMSLGGFREKKGTLRSYGFGCCCFGAVAGAGKILGFDEEKMTDAFGTAGNFAPLPGQVKWQHTLPSGMTKYGSAGWIAQGGVTAALLAEAGYRGDKTILDGDYGFWAMNGSESCNWDKMTDKLGQEWMVLKTTYKYWPCNGTFGSSLDAFTRVILDNDIKPEEIERVILKSERQGMLPIFHTMEMASHVDAQMNLPYNVAVAAHRVSIGPDWQARSTMEDPKILEFRKKVTYEAYDRCEEAQKQDLLVERRPYISRRPAYAEVIARGKSFTHQVEYAKWLSMDAPEFRASDEELAGKFRANAFKSLPGDRIEKAIELIFSLEKVDEIAGLMQVLS